MYYITYMYMSLYVNALEGFYTSVYGGYSGAKWD